MHKVLVSLTVISASLTVVALALFVLSDSGFVPNQLRGVAGSVLGTTTVLILTRSPRRGRRIAALPLLASLTGPCAFFLGFRRSSHDRPLPLDVPGRLVRECRKERHEREDCHAAVRLEAGS